MGGERGSLSNAPVIVGKKGHEVIRTLGGPASAAADGFYIILSSGPQWGKAAGRTRSGVNLIERVDAWGKKPFPPLHPK